MNGNYFVLFQDYVICGGNSKRTPSTSNTFREPLATTHCGCILSSFAVYTDTKSFLVIVKHCRVSQPFAITVARSVSWHRCRSLDLSVPPRESSKSSHSSQLRRFLTIHHTASRRQEVWGGCWLRQGHFQSSLQPADFLPKLYLQHSQQYP